MRILLILTLLFTIRGTSAPGRAELFIINHLPITVYEPLIQATVMVECGGNYKAYNPKTHDTGPFQIRPIRLKDYNQRTGKKYTMEDCFDYHISREIFLYYAKGKTFERAAREWNGGNRGMKKESTKRYWTKIQNQL